MATTLGWRRMSRAWERVVEEGGPSRTRRQAWLRVLGAVWVGMAAGWVELGFVVGRGWWSPHLSMDVLRTNRHYPWMIPLADAGIIGAVGVLLGALGWWRPRVGRGLGSRLPVGLAAGSVLLAVESLHPAGSALLACGVGSTLGCWSGRGGRALGRGMGLSLAGMGVGLGMLGWVWEERLRSAEVKAWHASAPGEPDAPNVVLLVLDDVRAASLSLYGHDRKTSPNLERLAKRGVLYREARATAPWTLPSHASMFTGRWPHETSAGWDVALDGAFPTLAEWLSGRGYATAGFIANTYYCHPLYGLGRGFARYEEAYENDAVSVFEILRSSGLGKRILQAFGVSIHVADGGTSVRKSAAMVNRDVFRWLERRPKERPFFVFVNYYDAHGPYVPPDQDGPRFGVMSQPETERVEVLAQFQRLTMGKAKAGDASAAELQERATQVFLDSYETCIASLDRQVGRLVDGLEAKGLLNNTLVIVTSDHGEHFREHGFFGHGRSLYRREVHVPLVVIPPGRGMAGTTVEEPVSLRDIPATVAQWVGGASPFPGTSLTKMGEARSAAISEVEHQVHLPRIANVPSTLGKVRSVAVGGLTYIRNEDGREELYEPGSDPTEVKDLAGDGGRRKVLEQARGVLGKVVEERGKGTR